MRRGLRAFRADRFRWLDEAAALGPVAGLRFGPMNAWVVSDATLARCMLLTDAGAWARAPQQLVPTRIAVGENLFTRSDRSWHEVQSHLAPHFRPRSLADAIDGIGSLLADGVAAIPLDRDVNVTPVLHRLALAAAARILFGDDLDVARADELVAHQRAVVDWVGTRITRATAALPMAGGADARAMREHRAALRAYATELITRDGAAPTPIMTALRTATRRRGARDDRAAVGEVLGLLFAGTETTAATVLWALVHGSRAPAQWDRLRTDPASVRRFTLETLRLTPSAWGLARTPAARRARLTSGDIEQVVWRPLVVSIYLRAINRNADIWPAPLRFDPDRFERPEPEQQSALLPFGLGARGCIGQHVAMAEITKLLPLLAAHGDVTLVAEPDEDPQFALRPREDLIVRFEARRAGRDTATP